MSYTTLLIVLVGVICCTFVWSSPVTDKAPRFQFDDLEAAALIRERRALPNPVTDKAPRFQFDGQFDDALEEAAPIRHKRATCDLLSGFGVNDSACAIHCIALGKRGGWCDSRRVCNCR
ncbi:defensin-A-like [Episyrphus balteatus]|uniref:defensin-A-like n=1 Tax=Episyrphus balteatus TaxID=286459 RepID=UPI0024853ECE|nr:defensin-A-like [Episyrphus balteatus]